MGSRNVSEAKDEGLETKKPINAMSCGVSLRGLKFKMGNMPRALPREPHLELRHVLPFQVFIEK